MKRWTPMLVAGLAFGGAVGAKAADVGMIKIKGAIGPATASYIVRSIGVSGARADSCLIIQLDTPGGLGDSTKESVEGFYASKVPVVVYVAPAGAWAASAGCFITMAADVAAMAPSTSIGAAHPVSMGMGEEKTNSGVMKKPRSSPAVTSPVSPRDGDVMRSGRERRSSRARH